VTASQVFNLGKLRFTYKGVYSSVTTYQANDVVRYNNSLYVYINVGSSAGRIPTETDFWSKMIDGFKDPTTGTNGQFVYTDGSAYQFRTISEVPSQTGEAGKFLKTNGTTASWSNSFGTLGVTGDLEVGQTAGELYVGAGAKTDAETLGTSVINAQTKALTSNVATITTATAHGFAPFQYVTIALSPADATFDGTWEIATTPTLNTFTFARTSGNISSQATVGTVSAVPGYTNPIMIGKADVDDYAQIAFRNANDGSSASTDIILYADNGTDFAGWIDMGVTSSTFSDPQFTITGANDGYIFYEAPVGTTGKGNLVLATGDKGTQNKIVFAAGGLESDNEQMSITPDSNVHIEIPTPSTSPTTGALTVVGGVGISGDLNIAGDVDIVGSISFGGGSTTSENLAVNDPIVFTGNSATGDTNDLGIVGKYVSSGTKYAGLVRDASDGIFKLFTAQTSAPTTTVNFGTASYADLQVNSLTAGGSVTVTGGLTISGTSDIQEMREVLVPVTITSNSAACDWTAGNIYWIGTAPSANFTVALTNVPTDNNRVMTINVFVTQGSTGYIPNALTIAGSAQTIKWPTAAAPTPTSVAGRIDVFTFTLVRVGSAWTVLGSANLNWG
jgi:cytoskeletal protein CcmA (bactofilin family)